jgi:hypothetical protein
VEYRVDYDTKERADGEISEPRMYLNSRVLRDSPENFSIRDKRDSRPFENFRDGTNGIRDHSRIFGTGQTGWDSKKSLSRRSLLNRPVHGSIRDKIGNSRKIKEFKVCCGQAFFLLQIFFNQNFFMLKIFFLPKLFFLLKSNFLPKNFFLKFFTKSY